MRTRASILVLAFAATVAGAEPVRVSELLSRVDGAVADLSAARASERATRDAQSALAHRISALKRADRGASDDAELERLLRDSIEADKVLARQIGDARRRQEGVARLVRDAFEQIDKRMKELTPHLAEARPLHERQRAQAELKELIGARTRMRSVLVSIKEKEEARKWTDGVVQIDPLDGPTELGDKADAVDLARTRIEKKKELLARLIREKRIAKAAQTFNSDVNVFDEAVRTGRVSRKEGGNPEAAVQLSDDADPANKGPEERAAPPQAPPVPQSGFATEADDGAAAPPPADPDPGRNDNLAGAAAQPQLGVSPTARGSVTALGQVAGAAPVAKQMDPNALINFPIDQLESEAVDIATLEKLIADLESLDAALADHAQKIRSRATQLERDEAKTRGSK
jgi:hypothetical protein